MRIVDEDYRAGNRLVVERRDIEFITEESLIQEIRSANYPEFWKQILKNLLVNEGRDTCISWFRK